jgi:hypothetical protein
MHTLNNLVVPVRTSVRTLRYFFSRSIAESAFNPYDIVNYWLVCRFDLTLIKHTLTLY